MKPNELKVLDMCIESGAARGLRQATKHNDSPTPEQVAEHVADAIESEIMEWFSFDAQGEE
jgi:hypothetical protein